MGTYLTGSGVCCALIPSVFSSPPRTDAILGDNWENRTTPQITYTTVTQNAHARTYTTNHKKTNSRRRNRDRAGVTGDWGGVEISGDEYEGF